MILEDRAIALGMRSPAQGANCASFQPRLRQALTRFVEVRRLVKSLPNSHQNIHRHHQLTDSYRQCT